MTDTTAPESSRFSILQQRISNITWIITLLLSLRGIFEFYGMKQKSSFEQAIIFTTEPFVQLFQFSFIVNLNIPALTVLLTALFLLILSYSARLFIMRTEQKYARMRQTLARVTISTTASAK